MYRIILAILLFLALLSNSGCRKQDKLGLYTHKEYTYNGTEKKIFVGIKAIWNF